ncbi:PREDICTED: mucin-4-like [Vollenhovia emeryi]|uniref:mucin-4-like n=1 Tax=Vollenhovia emeryi TaxID=411798 RepID=UPI0005F3A67A|nr:PREDICTED: mucin-4-like [Vollenhovia emeryi]
MLAIGGWNEGSSRFSPMVADSQRRREFVKNTVKFLRQNHFDGLDLDWEYPAFRDGGKPRDKDNYANLVQELREEFDRESSKTGRSRLLLSMAMPAGVEYIDKGYDVPRLNEYLDFVNLLSYDYHSAYEPVVNHHSPLYPLEEDNEYNYDAELTIDYTITYLLEKGASADKIILGIPTYGRSYTLFNQDATELGSPADGPGTEGEATREKGYLAYYEICEGIAESDEWEVVQPNTKAMGPYAFKGNQWVGYDDEDIVKLKAHYVNEKKLGGIMFWSIDNDDFRGKCHGRPYPLIEAAKEALLADNSRNTIDKTKSVDNRKKTRTQSNARKSSASSRRGSTTSAPITSKRVSSSRPKYRVISQASKEEQEDREVSRRSYDPSSDEDTEGRNTVRVTEKIERPKNRSRNKTRSGATDRSTRRKQSRRKGQSKTGEDESLSNKLTTPEPPTTPDPGTDFKCEDEGFFPHPRDCKKYFWCLDSGPSGLGVVAHQFTCPSGLVFNKGADSCDYPRNVICPKALKTLLVSTTRSPITAATSRTTYLHSTTTAKAESEEYDSEEDYDEIEESEEEEEEEEEEEKIKEEPKTTTTAKPLVYKTLTRNRPSTTTTTTTTTSKPSEPEKIIDNEDEEDPKVIKELIDLIKKAGGIEELEKQLLLQEKNSDTRSGSESVTPAAISRSLYERVLNRQASRIGNHRPALSSSETSYVNGPGRAQFEGLDDIPEVKSLRRSQKPQYVTIERSRSVASLLAKESSSENEDIDEEEESDNTDVASSEEKTVSNPLEDSSSTQRVTPSYVNIRRTRLSTTTSRTENDVGGKEVEIEEERPTRRRRPFVSSKQQDNEASSETSKRFRNRGSSFRKSEKRDDSRNTNRSAEKDDDSSTTKSRYASIQRFRSTTLKTSDDLSSSIPLSEVTSETISPTRLEENSEVSRTTASTTASLSTTPAATISTSTEIITVISVEPPENSSSASPKADIGSTTDSMKLVEDSATEILFTTLPAASSSSSPSTTTTTTTLATRPTIAVVSQPRPFGFTRRKFGSSEATTAATTPLSRSKVSITSRNPTRPSSPVLGRVRLRTRPTNRVTEEESVDQVNTPSTETSTSRSKELSRSRSRGSSRYTPPTSRSRTQNVSANSVPGTRYRERDRTTASTTVTSDGLRRRYRRPSRINGAVDSIKANELDDSPIVRITQGSSRKNPLSRSRSDSSDEESDKITNVRVFRKPTVNRELYDRTKYTRKRNNVEEQKVQKVNDASNQKHNTTSITVPRTSSSAETDKIEGNDLLNSVDQSTATVDSVVESNTIQPIYTVKPNTQISVTTVPSSKVDYTSDRPEDAVATTTAHIEAHAFNPDLVTIVSTERTVDTEEKTLNAPRKRKVLLRRRPISSSTAANIIETEEEERLQVSHRRKVIKRKRPFQGTSSTSVEVSEEENSSPLLLETTTPMGSNKTVEKSTAAFNQTGITPINKSAEESTIATGRTEFTKEMEDSTLTIMETTLPTDYNADSFTKVTLETPATETTTISTEKATDSLNTATISMTNTDANEGRQSTIEMGTEATTMESTLSTPTIYNTETTMFLEDTSMPSTENLPTTRVRIIVTSPTLDAATTRAQATTTPESDSLLAAKSSFESRYARKKFIRKSPVSSSGNGTNRYPPALSSTENSSLEVLSRRRSSLFTRQFWKQYTTTSVRGQVNHPSVRVEDVEDRKVAEHAEDNAYRLTSIATRGPDTIRSRYKVPVILKRPFDPEEALSPRRYPPLDSAPEESEETPETKEARLRQSTLRQPRTRYKLQDRDSVKIDEEATLPNAESPSKWLYFRTRSYPKRTSSTSTEAAVTETLIPAKKFDYAADAFLRKQQSLRTTTPRSNDFLDSQNLIDPYYMRTTTVKPSVTRLVTSVTESGTTERQKILIKTKYSSLTSTTRIPADQFSPTTPLSVSVTGVDDDESANEIRQGVERSTLPIESEFNYRYDGRFTTESHESSTIEIESVFNNLIVADLEAIRLPTLKELIGYPTTYYDDRTATTSSSVLLHLLRNDVDNDISRQNVEESLRGADESQDGEKEITQSPRGVIEETGDSWLRQASENKARSRAPRMENITNFDEGVSVTNTIQGGGSKRKTSTTSVYLKPTTMRGIPLASLIPSPVKRGFYITRSENDLPSSILADSFTPSYTTIDTPIEVQQAETTLISDSSTIDETVTVTRNNQIESGPNALDDNVNDIVSDKGVDSREEKYSTPSPSVIFSKDNAENLSNHEKPDVITIPVARPASKRRKPLRDFDRTTPLSNSFVVSSTTPTRRRIALAVNRYNEATTPLWTGRRIVAKKRIRTTVSPIKDAVRRIESDSIRAETSTQKSASPTTRSVSTLTSRRRRPPATSTIPTIPSIMPDSTASEILNTYNNLVNSKDTKTEDPESQATVETAVTLTNSVITATPLIVRIISTTNDPRTADISTFSDDPTTMTVPAVANDASITTAPSTVTIAKAPAVTTDATITTTAAITSIEVETTSLNYSVTDNPTIENTNAILTDSTATIAFEANAETEITSTNVNIVPETAQTFVTDPVVISTIESTEIETTPTMTNYSTIEIPNTANAQEIAMESANTATMQIKNPDIDAISTVANYSAVTIPSTVNMQNIMTDAISITTASTEVETISTGGNYSTFTTTIKNTTTIPVTATVPVTTTASPLTTVISSAMNTQHATAPMTNNLVDANTITANMITTPLSVITPTIADLNVITSANANVPSTSAISETSSTINQPRTSSVTSFKAPVTGTVITSTTSATPTLITEASTIHLSDPNNLDSRSNSKVAVTVTAESTQTTEIPTTFETAPVFTSTVTASSKPPHSTDFEASSIVTAALPTQEVKSFFMPEDTQTPSTLPSIVTLSTNKATVTSERSATSPTLSAIFGESFTRNSIMQRTYDANSVRTTEKSTMPEQKTDFKEVTSTKTQSRTEDQIITTITKLSSRRTTSEESTTPEMKIVYEETTSKATENQKQNQTSSELDTTNYQFSQKTARRRVLNRTNNWLGSSVTLQRTNQSPRHRVTLHHGRSRRPPIYTSSAKMTEKNRRRRIMQKRIRVNSEAFNSTVRPNQDTVNIPNTTEDHVAYDRVENVKEMKVVLGKMEERVGKETTTILPTEEITVFLQSSTTIKNETLRENKNIEENQKAIPKKVKHSQESFTTTETSTSSSFTNESVPDNYQNNLHVAEDLSEPEKPKEIMKVDLKNIKSQSEEKNPIKEIDTDSDSIKTDLQDNFSKNPYADTNLSNKGITRRRMRVVLKRVRHKSDERNSTIEETNVESVPTDKNFENNLSNNVNVSQNFSNEEKPRRRMRVVLKRVKSEEARTKTEETNTEYDSNESLQGTFSNNFYSAKNFPEYKARRRMRVVLKSVKPKSEEKNSTVEETTANHDPTNETLQGTLSNNFRDGRNLPIKSGTKRRMRVVLKSIKSKSEKGNSTAEETNVDPDSINKNQSAFVNNSHRDRNIPIEYGTKRRMRVILKSVKPKSEEKNSTIEETSIDSDSVEKDLQGSFSDNLYMNEHFSNEEEARKRTEVSVKPNSKERDSVAEETSADSDSRKDPQVLHVFNFSSNLHVGDNLPDKKKKHSESKGKEAMTERPEDMEPQTTRTSVPVEEDTDRPSLEVKNGGSVSHSPGNGYSNRHRKPTSFTTVAPLTNTLSNTLTVHRRRRPVETTLSSRIDLVDTFEDTEPYVKSAGILHDQNTDVSDQSIHAQEFAVTLSNPPSSSSDIGRTPLRDADRRKISTTISPRTDPTTSTVSRYDTNFRSRQRPRSKDRPTVNTTTRPRRPPVIDYDYYEDEVPIIADKSVFNSKLFLTSKGTVRCLDQGNFPHPYSCKKFITCAPMVNGQVIGTEYTCPDKLSFDPIGGICNWSAGLGCKD